MARPILHQVTVGATIGDAITDQAFALRRWLRDMGFVSEVYAQQIHPALDPNHVQWYATYRYSQFVRCIDLHIILFDFFHLSLLGS